MDLYAQNVMDHYRNPRNTGTIETPTIHHQEANYSCGDKAAMDLVVESNILKDIKYIGSGCAISQAAISIMSEIIKGKSVDEIMDLKEEDIVNMLGVPIGYRRKKCALLGLLTLKNALLTMQGNENLKWYDLSDELVDGTIE